MPRVIVGREVNMSTVGLSETFVEYYEVKLRVPIWLERALSGLYPSVLIRDSIPNHHRQPWQHVSSS